MFTHAPRIPPLRLALATALIAGTLSSSAMAAGGDSSDLVCRKAGGEQQSLNFTLTGGDLQGLNFTLTDRQQDISF